MAKVASKFKAHLPEIWDAIEGDIALRSANQKLYKKIYKYYKNLGVIFCGDSKLDYDTVLDCLYEDLE